MKDLIIIEPVTVGEILPFVTSIILLIITWRSLSNAKKGNETTKNSVEVAKQALELQNEQFIYSLKPDFIFDIPSKTIFQSVYNIEHINDFGVVFQDYFLKNSSQNVCYDISVKCFVYMYNDDWDQYHKVIRESLKNDLDIVNLSSLVSPHELYSLGNNEKMTVSIPPYFHYLSTKPFNVYPNLYVIIKYKDKIGNIYEDCFQFDRIMETIAESSYIIDFEPKAMSTEDVKEDLLNQQNYLADKHGSARSGYFYKF